MLQPSLGVSSLDFGRPSGGPSFWLGNESEWFTRGGGFACTESADDRAFFSPRQHIAHCSAMFFLLFLAGLWAGAQNALAGGGSFVTLPALVLAGLDPRAANITSTVALFPGQVTSGLAARSLVERRATSLVSGAVRDQPHRRGARRHPAAGNSGRGVVGPDGAVARPVCDGGCSPGAASRGGPHRQSRSAPSRRA